eukprot:1144307-Pelagomonas_calceolata.AAC.5
MGALPGSGPQAWSTQGCASKVGASKHGYLQAWNTQGCASVDILGCPDAQMDVRATCRCSGA